MKRSDWGLHGCGACCMGATIVNAVTAVVLRKGIKPNTAKDTGSHL
ncbi:MAG: hypothetical protein LBT83_01495 [Tannerella sp.]|nr:hypothetical protein [Tannerella sp.]